jgi:hypothetical protein
VKKKLIGVGLSWKREATMTHEAEAWTFDTLTVWRPKGRGTWRWTRNRDWYRPDVCEYGGSRTRERAMSTAYLSLEASRRRARDGPWIPLNQPRLAGVASAETIEKVYTRPEERSMGHRG